MVFLVVYFVWVYFFEVVFLNFLLKRNFCIVDNIVDMFFVVDIVLMFFVVYID